MKITELTSEHIFVECDAIIGNKLGAVYVKSRKLYRLPNNLGALRELHAMGLPVIDYGVRRMKERARFLAKKKGVPHLYPSFNQNLRPYQMADASYLLQGKAFGVFNEQRTGKSPTMVQVIESLGKTTILIVPASLILNWEQEFLKWSNIVPTVVNTTPKFRKEIYKNFKGGVLIISKDLSLIHI